VDDADCQFIDDDDFEYSSILSSVQVSVALAKTGLTSDDQCTLCAAGKWTNKTGLRSADQCEYCPAGFGAPQEMALTEVECNGGKLKLDDEQLKYVNDTFTLQGVKWVPCTTVESIMPAREDDAARMMRRDTCFECASGKFTSKGLCVSECLPGTTKHGDACVDNALLPHLYGRVTMFVNGVCTNTCARWLGGLKDGFDQESKLIEKVDDTLLCSLMHNGPTLLSSLAQTNNCER